MTALFDAECVVLLGYFLRRVNDPDVAADLVGDTALTLWRRVSDLPSEPEQARMWMYGVARRVLATARRGSQRRNALSDRLRVELMVDLNRSPPDGRIEALLVAIKTLPPRDRELIGLVHWEGFTITQAATMLGIRVGTAQMRLQRARARLKQQLDA